MFRNLRKKEAKHDDNMTVWVPKGVYNTVEPLWDARYAWHPIPVDDSLPMGQTSFLQIDADRGGHSASQAQQAATQQAPTSRETSQRPGRLRAAAPAAPAADAAAVRSAVSTRADLPDIDNGGGDDDGARARPGLSALARTSSFGFPVRQMTWNTRRRKRAAQLQRQKSRAVDRHGVPNRGQVSLAPPPPRRGGRAPDTRPSPWTADSRQGADFVMFAL